MRGSSIPFLQRFRPRHLSPWLILLVALAAGILGAAAVSAEQAAGLEDPPAQAEEKTSSEAGEALVEEESAETEEQPVYENTLKWSTASEVENFGYDIYRSESPDGPFARINEEPVPGAGTSDEVNHYRYVDDTIDPRRGYYYYVESIDMSGVRRRFTPVVEAPAKIPADEDEGAEGREESSGEDGS